MEHSSFGVYANSSQAFRLTIKICDVFRSMVKTALFGLMPACETRSDSDVEFTRDPLYGEPLLTTGGVKQPFLLAEKRKPLKPSTGN